MLTAEALAEVYDELHRLARSFLRHERANHTLQPSALINEAYLRLRAQDPSQVVDRPHFLRLAARAMRQVLIDHARIRRARKRDAASLADAMLPEATPALETEEYLAINTALEKLESIDPNLAEIVELRFFGGLSVSETAQVLGISETSVKREWAVARVWLRGELDGASQSE